MSFVLYESEAYARQIKNEPFRRFFDWVMLFYGTHNKNFLNEPRSSRCLDQTGTPYIDFYLTVGSFVFVVLMLYVFSVYDYNARDVYALYLRVFFRILFRINYFILFIKI